MPAWLTTKEAMAYLKIRSRTTFYRLISEGKVRPYTISGTDEKRYLQEELDQLLVPAQPDEILNED
jgi:excisionase family DNA binding protein